MKLKIILIIIMAMSVSVAAHDTTSVEGPWKSSGMTSLNFSQLALQTGLRGHEFSLRRFWE